MYIAAFLCHIGAIIAFIVGRDYILFIGYVPIIFSTVYLCYKSYKKVDTVAEKQEKHP
jgi:4-hydroxybenzoate polyprenyltransferase